MTEIEEMEENGFVVEENEYNLYNKKLKFVNNGGFSSIDMRITAYPTGNCQMFSIGHFNSIKHISIERRKEIIIKTILYCRENKCASSIMLIDINKCNEQQLITELFKQDKIIHKHEYVSTNKSNMVLCMINTTDLDNLFL